MERSYLVKLTADTTKYVQAFKRAKDSTDEFEAESEKSLQNVGAGVEDVGATVHDVGRSMSGARLSLPAVDTSEARASAEELDAILDSLSDEQRAILLAVDSDTAERKLGSVRSDVGALDGRRAEVEVDADRPISRMVSTTPRRARGRRSTTSATTPKVCRASSPMSAVRQARRWSRGSPRSVPARSSPRRSSRRWNAATASRCCVVSST